MQPALAVFALLPASRGASPSADWELQSLREAYNSMGIFDLAPSHGAMTLNHPGLAHCREELRARTEKACKRLAHFVAIAKECCLELLGLKLNPNHFSFGLDKLLSNSSFAPRYTSCDSYNCLRIREACKFFPLECVPGTVELIDWVAHYSRAIFANCSDCNRSENHAPGVTRPLFGTTSAFFYDQVILEAFAKDVERYIDAVVMCHRRASSGKAAPCKSDSCRNERAQLKELASALKTYANAMAALHAESLAIYERNEQLLADLDSQLALQEEGDVAANGLSNIKYDLIKHIVYKKRYKLKSQLSEALKALNEIGSKMFKSYCSLTGETVEYFLGHSC
ncbi:hypothetical protein PAPHI01_1733 [Pancytospora philotis]|nr:hypothetical protein PAPHI01_1733 [Pancytospora philotis]